MSRPRLGISQAAAAVAALAATAAIIAFTITIHLPNVLTLSRIAAGESREAERLSGVRLSLVAIINGRAIISNDGVQPATIKKIFTSNGVITLTNPITIQPGQKVSINIGNTDALAVELEGSGSLKVVLKEKPALQGTIMRTTSTTRTTTTMTTTSTTTRWWTSWWWPTTRTTTGITRTATWRQTSWWPWG